MTRPPSEKHNSLAEFLDWKASDPSVAGLGLFGSVAKREAVEGSDIDVLELRTDVRGRSVQKIQSRSGLIDVQTWPLGEFTRILSGDSSSAYYDAFKFDVLRTAEILHDPRNLLNKMKAFTSSNSLPHSSRLELLKDSRARMQASRRLLERNLLGESQIVLRQAVDGFAKSAILRSDIAAINPSRTYLGSLKSIDEQLHALVLNVYGVEKTDAYTATSLVRSVNAWVRDLTMKTEPKVLSTRNGLLLSHVASEIGDASRDLCRGDSSAALVEARHAAVLLNQCQNRLRADGPLKDGAPEGRFPELRAKSTKCELLGLSNDIQRLREALDELAWLMETHNRRTPVRRLKN